MRDTDFTTVATPPKRQGFYMAKLKSGDEVVAEWREYDKKQGKQWWQHVSDDPTVEKKPALLLDVKAYGPVEKAVVEAALRRELTPQEKIDKAVAAYRVHADIYPGSATTPPPAQRPLKIGDEVELGNLRNCKVVALVDDGRVVVLTHEALRRSRGSQEDVVEGLVYHATHWTNLVAIATRRTDTLVQEPVMWDGYRTSAVSSMMHRVLNGLDDNPTYQRDYVWTPQDKERLLDSLFAGREIGRFMFVNREYPHRMQILDGKQRLNCLWEFYTSQLAYRGMYWHELSARDRSRLESRTVQFVDLEESRYSKADLLKIFLEVNAAGVPQSEEHLATVRAQLEEELARQAK